MVIIDDTMQPWSSMMTSHLDSRIAAAPVAGIAPHGRAPSVYPAKARETAHKRRMCKTRGG